MLTQSIAYTINTFVLYLKFVLYLNWLFCIGLGSSQELHYQLI